MVVASAASVVAVAPTVEAGESIVAMAPSVEDGERKFHVSCGPCFWGEDVDEAEANQFATEHMRTREHLQAEAAEQLVERLAEALRIDRGW
jgi:hypothetical protein